MKHLKMSAWYALLCWMFICLLGHAEAGKLTLIGPQTRVVLVGHDVHLNFTVTVPDNTTLGFLQCFHGNKCMTPAYILDHHRDQKQNKEVVLLFNRSSESGEYYCTYMGARVDLAILACDEGFKRTYIKDEIIAPVAILTVVLLIFSTVGSGYIYKSQAAHEGHGDSGTSTTQNRTSQKGDDEGQEGTAEEAADAANSVYTALESRTTSIYDVLDRSASTSSSGRTQSKRKTSKSSNIKDEVASAEDGVFESVYENL